VTGKLQSESDVIHIVAEKIEDLTPWLTVLLEKVSGAAPPQGHASRNGPDPSSQSMTSKAPVRQDFAVLSEEAERVMPKGRNFQ